MFEFHQLKLWVQLQHHGMAYTCQEFIQEASLFTVSTLVSHLHWHILGSDVPLAIVDELFLP